MSNNFLNLIPKNPAFVPDNTAQLSARMFLAKRYSDNQIDFITTDNTEFIDQGANFESVSCNLCGHPLEIDYWQSAMDSAFQSRFDNLNFVTPCCMKITSLNDLNYKWPAGFARHIIQISNPSDLLLDDEVSQLEEIVGTDLKVVRTRY